MIREITDPAGGFHSTQDAVPTPLRSGDDRSEGEEGRFFVWTPDEIRDVPGDDAHADAFMRTCGETRPGNASTGSAHGLEGKIILELVGDMDQRSALAEARRRLFEARERRVHPGRGSEY